MADTFTRATTPDPDDWWLPEPAPAQRDTYDPADGSAALELLADSLTQARDVLGVQDYVLSDAVRCLVENADMQGLVDTVAMLQDLKRNLAVAEAFVAREAGYLAQEFTAGKTGQTSDGRPYEILRGAVRKSWDHDAWKSDVRRALAGDLLNREIERLDPATGEITSVDVATLLEQAQAVHGSTAPRSTALKALGLDPDDYCQSSPGPYTVKITQPTPF